MTVHRLAPRAPQTMTEAVAAEVRALAGRHQVTQGELAAVLGVSRQALNKRLLGVTPIDVNELALLADFFGVQPTELLPRNAASAPSSGQGARVVLPHLDSNQEPAGSANMQVRSRSLYVVRDSSAAVEPWAESPLVADRDHLTRVG